MRPPPVLPRSDRIVSDMRPPATSPALFLLLALCWQCACAYALATPLPTPAPSGDANDIPRLSNLQLLHPMPYLDPPDRGGERGADEPFSSIPSDAFTLNTETDSKRTFKKDLSKVLHPQTDASSSDRLDRGPDERDITDAFLVLVGEQPDAGDSLELFTAGDYRDMSDTSAQSDGDSESKHVPVPDNTPSIVSADDSDSVWNYVQNPALNSIYSNSETEAKRIEKQINDLLEEELKTLTPFQPMTPYVNRGSTNKQAQSDLNNEHSDSNKERHDPHKHYSTNKGLYGANKERYDSNKQHYYSSNKEHYDSNKIYYGPHKHYSTNKVHYGPHKHYESDKAHYVPPKNYGLKRAHDGLHQHYESNKVHYDPHQHYESNKVHYDPHHHYESNKVHYDPHHHYESNKVHYDPHQHYESNKVHYDPHQHYESDTVHYGPHVHQESYKDHYGSNREESSARVKSSVSAESEDETHATCEHETVARYDLLRRDLPARRRQSWLVLGEGKDQNGQPTLVV